MLLSNGTELGVASRHNANISLGYGSFLSEHKRDHMEIGATKKEQDRFQMGRGNSNLCMNVVLKGFTPSPYMVWEGIRTIINEEVLSGFLPASRSYNWLNSAFRPPWSCKGRFSLVGGG